MKKKQQKLSLKKLKIATVTQISSLQGGATKQACDTTNGLSCADSLVVCETDDCVTIGSCECTIQSLSKTK